MKLAIVGSRDIGFELYPQIEQYAPPNVTAVISGGAVGVDRLAERYAEEKGLPLQVFYPDYDLLGSRAPIQRNTQIVEASDYVLIFWNGRSRGSSHVIMSCIRKNKPFRVLMT